jgi:AraC family transcriptional regulator
MQFHGQLLRRGPTRAFRVTETVFPGGSVVPWHQHGAAYISILLAGAYGETTPERTDACRSGTAIWHPPGERHRDVFGSNGGHVLNLEIDAPWLDDHGIELRLPTRRCVVPSLRAYPLGLGFYRLADPAVDQADEIACDLLGWFSEERFERRPGWFVRLIEFVQESPNGSLSLTAAARAVGIHPVHVARSFRRFLGCSFGEYLGEVRLRRAFELLDDPSTSITSVAMDAGYYDHAHLCRTFRRVVGLTPSAYRRRRQARSVGRSIAERGL